MTREEERNKARWEYVSKRLANPDFPTYNAEYELESSFDKGAKWADEHPSLHVVASLMHLLRSGRIDTTTTNADVLTQLQIELKNRDKTNQSKAL